MALPPRAVARKVAERLGGAWTRSKQRARDLRDGTFGGAMTGKLNPLLHTRPDATLLAANRDWISGMAALHRNHRFDMLGSGWVQVRHGMACRGTAGHCYNTGPAVDADPTGSWLDSRMVASNRRSARELWALIEQPYQPVDWHLDFKSGYRWPEETWHADIPIGHRPGADVKVPWELARMHHLTTLALCYGLHGGDGEEAAASLRAFRNQILDFTATNPPRFGVNWRCPMDVAIRAANWAMAYSLFRAFGAVFDVPFEDALRDSLYRHGVHVFTHLEWDPEYRANHYLADITGLLFIAAVLPRNDETDGWLAFAVSALTVEADFQFLADGGNFEASTAYHRLSAEMVAFGLALTLGLPDGKRAAVRSFVPASMAGMLARAAAFTAGLEKPDGRMPQIGDNDSGRFFKLAPAVVRRSAGEIAARYAGPPLPDSPPAETPLWDEDACDHRHLPPALGALFTGAPVETLDAAVLRGLARHNLFPATRAAPDSSFGDPLPAPPDDVTRTRIEVPGGCLCNGLETRCWPAFGLFLFRSDRLYLLVRCGQNGQNGRGGHAHNDQLAIELAVDGEDWIADPGSYLYTADRTARDAYRSISAHAAPRQGHLEPARLDLGDFWLEDSAQARCLGFGLEGFAGAHDGFGHTVTRWVVVEDDAVEIIDSPGDGADRTLTGRDAVRDTLAAPIPYSPGYGLQRRGG